MSGAHGGSEATAAEAIAATRRHLERGDLTCILCDHGAAEPLGTPWPERFGPAFAGFARTVRAAGGELASVREAVGDLENGEVLVVQGPNDRAIFGGSLATAAGTRGAAGAVIEGLVRDVAELAAVPGFGAVARGRRSVRSDPAAVGARDVPLVLGRATVRPSDLVVVDANDAVRIVPEALSAVAAKLDAWVADEDA